MHDDFFSYALPDYSLFILKCLQPSLKVFRTLAKLDFNFNSTDMFDFDLENQTNIS